jgi:hypothetical protein
MEGVELCGRCAREIRGDGELEGCWFCEGALCIECWDRYGVCGCPGSDQAQTDLLKTSTHAERAEIMNRPGPVGRVRRREH